MIKKRRLFIFLIFAVGFAGLHWVNNAAALKGKATSTAKGAAKFHLFAPHVRGARFLAITNMGNILVTQTGLGRVSFIKTKLNSDGLSDGQVIVLSGLQKPSGLLLDDTNGKGTALYIAEEEKIWRYQFDEATAQARDKTLVLEGMPKGGHSTRIIKKGPDGYFYVAIGSSCNICQENHPWRASLIRFKPGEKPTVYATGLRNMVGFDWHPKTGKLYGSNNGCDGLGDDFPPEEISVIVKDGFYGWPYFCGGQVTEPFKDFLKTAKIRSPQKPVYKIQAHSAPLSLKFLRYQDNGKVEALVGLHGSWNHSSKVGYKVVRLTFADGGTISQDDFLTGFLKDGRVLGRPVDVVEGKDGTIYVSDDYAGRIWRVVR